MRTINNNPFAIFPNIAPMDMEQLNNWEQRFTAWWHQRPVDDGAHDLAHFRRVWHAAKCIASLETEPADLFTLLTAAYFHDLVSLPKNHPERSQSSWYSAEKTEEVLKTDFPDFPMGKLPCVKHAIHAHSFSAQVTPTTVEAKILQDADRMEALGAIGIARTFYVSGQMNRAMFHPDDPLAESRPLDDLTYALDHFQVKLFKLPDLMNTAAGKQMAVDKVAFVREFMIRMAAEAQGV
ncbi:phosphohydrolase [soil metagenome]